MIHLPTKIFSKYQVSKILEVDKDDLTPLYLQAAENMKYGYDFVLLKDVQADYDGSLYDYFFPLYEEEEPNPKVIDIVGEVFLTEEGLEKIAKLVNTINARYLIEKFKRSKRLLEDFRLYSSVGVGTELIFTIMRDFAQNELDKLEFYCAKTSRTDKR